VKAGGGKKGGTAVGRRGPGKKKPVSFGTGNEKKRGAAGSFSPMGKRKGGGIQRKGNRPSSSPPPEGAAPHREGERTAIIREKKDRIGGKEIVVFVREICLEER